MGGISSPRMRRVGLTGMLSGTAAELHQVILAVIGGALPWIIRAVARQLAE